MPKARQLRRQPSGANYRSWKEDVAIDCHSMCVYCAVDDSMKGIEVRFFTIDHFRPKSKFEDLEIQIGNLYYCCGVCNSYKSDDWPGAVRDVARDVGYIDPADHDYNDHLKSHHNGLLVAKSPSGRYMLEKLHLNRAQLILRRRIWKFEVWRDKFEERVKMLFNRDLGVEELRALFDCVSKIREVEKKIGRIRVTTHMYRE